MPWLRITSAVVALALAGPGLAQEAVLPDSLNPTLAPLDAPGQVALPPADSLALPPAQSDPLALPVLLPAAAPTVAPPALENPTPMALQPVAQPLPKRTRYEARRGGFFTTRTLWGVACIAGSVVLYNKGSDYRQKADDLYGLYKRAADPTQIETLYQRTTNQDTKGQVCWALGAALAANGVRLLLTRDTEVVSSARAARPALHLILAPQSLQLRVRTWL